MIKKLNSILSKVNDAVGIEIDIPKPTKSGLKLSRVLSTTLGVGGLTIGGISSSKVLLALGTLGTISAIVTTYEIKKL
ncbi:hypothetical protein [uncultured Clostridium sp.]|uniref:hypothetical protein n=1 Tax=uncultured Clostridium sp. TaxID=59620 RepID=UPI0028E3951A|nr:hypothetical protein [uncultured Clostridium sp.]